MPSSGHIHTDTCIGAVVVCCPGVVTGWLLIAQISFATGIADILLGVAAV